MLTNLHINIRVAPFGCTMFSSRHDIIVYQMVGYLFSFACFLLSVQIFLYTKSLVSLYNLSKLLLHQALPAMSGTNTEHI